MGVFAKPDIFRNNKIFKKNSFLNIQLGLNDDTIVAASKKWKIYHFSIKLSKLIDQSPVLIQGTPMYFNSGQLALNSKNIGKFLIFDPDSPFESTPLKKSC